MRALALIGLACAAGASAARGQVSATLDAGISAVKYDGFLLSGAASVTPSVRWEHPRGRGFISARGTYLRFQSGNRSLDAALSGSWFMPLARRWRGELGVTAGASDYANIASFSHGMAEARLHLIDAAKGAWVGASVGGVSFGARPRPVSVGSLGAWLLQRDVTWFASVDRSFVGDTAYTDLRSSARWQRGRVLIEGTMGTRVMSRGGGRGVYGEAATTVPLGDRTSLVVAGGLYPTDAVSGSIAARYVTIAIRLGSISTRPAPRRALPVRGYTTRSGSNGSTDPAADARLQVQPVDDAAVRLTVFAPGATSVEISGDFTDWRPISLIRSPTDYDAWGGTFRMPRGIHRINVRRDGGRWMAPAGTTRSADDFDGEVGVFLLP